MCVCLTEHRVSKERSAAGYMAKAIAGLLAHEIHAIREITDSACSLIK